MLDEHTASSGSFHIVMTNNSNQYVKVTKNQTLGMLKSCDSDQICTIHRIVTLEPKPLEGEGIKPIYTKSPHAISSIDIEPTDNNKSEIQIITKDFYHIPTRNKKGEIEMLTLLKDEVPKILEKLLIRNKDCFAEDEHQLGTTGDHPPVAKRPYTLALKHHD